MRYGSLPEGGRAPARRSSTGVYAVIAVLAGAALVGVALQARSAPQELAGAGYVGWLKTLNGPVDYQTGKEHDATFDSAGMPHADISEMVPSALPKSEKVAAMQGEDFAKDVVEGSLPPVDQDEINKMPKKLLSIKAAVAKEQVLVDDLKEIVDAHSVPQPESIVVHVGQRGPRGADGPRGVRGGVGDQGTKGDTGPVGPLGDVGKRGFQGERGVDGALGPLGEQGRTGYLGRPGTRGTVGIEGPEGPEGGPGRDGEFGPPGPQGPNGANGMEGSKGNMGHEGSAGPGKPLTCLAVEGNVCYSMPMGPANYAQSVSACARWAKGASVFSFQNEKQWLVAQTVFSAPSEKWRFWSGLTHTPDTQFASDLSADWKFRSDGITNKYANTKWSGSTTRKSVPRPEHRHPATTKPRSCLLTNSLPSSWPALPREPWRRNWSRLTPKLASPRLLATRFDPWGKFWRN